METLKVTTHKTPLGKRIGARIQCLQRYTIKRDYLTFVNLFKKVNSIQNRFSDMTAFTKHKHLKNTEQFTY